MRKPNVGDILFIVSSTFSGKNPKTESVEVIKVGRKYFDVSYVGSSIFSWTFFIENWHEKTDYCSRVSLYESEQEYRDYVEKCEWSTKFRRFFEGFCSNVTLEQYRKIADILGLNKGE